MLTPRRTWIQRLLRLHGTPHARGAAHLEAILHAKVATIRAEYTAELFEQCAQAVKTPGALEELVAQAGALAETGAEDPGIFDRLAFMSRKTAVIAARASELIEAVDQ
jgi:hypothetical protein